ncbi:hypothetical protein [Saccharopolyspora gregorii]|uniref:hypothetical protein n=1 Tax=Saccharopolyspora gregorii TaxID=33914 RepID=UPI0031E67621
MTGAVLTPFWPTRRGSLFDQACRRAAQRSARPLPLGTPAIQHDEEVTDHVGHR